MPDHCPTCKQSLSAESQQPPAALDGERLREALETIAEDWWPPTDRYGVCLECGKWTPARHPEAHYHKDDCKAAAEFRRREDVRKIARDALSRAPAAPGEQERGRLEAEVVRTQLDERARWFAMEAIEDHERPGWLRANQAWQRATKASMKAIEALATFNAAHPRAEGQGGDPARCPECSVPSPKHKPDCSTGRKGGVRLTANKTTAQTSKKS